MTTAQQPGAGQAAKPVILKGHTGSVYSLAFSPDCKTLASGGADRTVKLWDLNSGQAKLTLGGHAGSVWAVAFDPSGKLLASGSGLLNPQGDAYLTGEITLWNPARGSVVFYVRGHTKMVNSVAFSANGDVLASASDDATVKLWRLEDGKLTLWRSPKDDQPIAVGKRPRGPDAISAVIFSPDSKTLAWDGKGHSIKLWDIAADKLARTCVGHDSFVRHVTFSQDGKLLASASDDCVKVWDAATGKETMTLAGHKGVVYGATFSPNAKQLATGGHDGAIHLWDLSTRRRETLLEHPNNTVYSLKFSPDGTWLAAARSDGTIVLWPIRKARN